MNVIYITVEGSVKMAAASGNESTQRSDHEVTSSDLVKTEDRQAQAPERHVSIQTSLEGLEMLVDLNGGKEDFQLKSTYCE